jgi:hypothetical protein
VHPHLFEVLLLVPVLLASVAETVLVPVLQVLVAEMVLA